MCKEPWTRERQCVDANQMPSNEQDMPQSSDKEPTLQFDDFAFYHRSKKESNI